jgi:hypothetical protein
MGSEGSLPGGGAEQLEHEADHSSSSDVEVTNRGAIPPLPQYVFLAYLFKPRDSFTFTFTLPYLLSYILARDEII